MRKPLLIGILFVGLTGYATTASAGLCDLTANGSTCSINTAIFTNVFPTGRIYLDSFLEIQAKTTEQGYNTGSSTLGLDTKAAESVSTSELSAVSLNGTSYYQFFLDIDEPANDPLLTLEKLQIFLSPSSTLTGYSNNTLAGLTSIYDLDTGGNSWINLNYSLQPGANTGTMIAYVPTSLFATPGYVYLYSQFGSSASSNPSYVSGGGVEEWWIKTTQANSDLSINRVANPEPGTLILLGSALSMLGIRLRKRWQKDRSAAVN